MEKRAQATIQMTHKIKHTDTKKKQQNKYITQGKQSQLRKVFILKRLSYIILNCYEEHSFSSIAVQ